MRIVLIDDNDDIRFLMRFQLEMIGLSVVGEGANGLEGIEVVRRQRPDLVVVDMAMPGLDGVDTTYAIKAGMPRATVVAFTSTSDRRAIGHILEAGAEVHFDKMRWQSVIDWIDERARLNSRAAAS